jgi:hypothetical protein
MTTNYFVSLLNASPMPAYDVATRGTAYQLPSPSDALLILRAENSYGFDLSDPSLSGSGAFELSETPDGSWNAGTVYSEGVYVQGTPGEDGAVLVLQLGALVSIPSDLYVFSTFAHGRGFRMQIVA